ncbi:MAG: FKBP-type peptidyl-prolyl cis-trans isomerase [bacterium]|nr:FKBP-type peptidyl-prolyl cis-trans isomerase [bacterium]
MSKKILVFILVLIAAVSIYYFGFYQKPSQSSQESMNQISGLEKVVLTLGQGKQAENGDTVVVHYVGTFLDGVKFDSSLDRGEPFSFVLGAGRVIQGWDYGVLGMQVGEKIKLTIAPELAYGAVGVPGAIPGNSTLVFEVELLEIK